MSSPWENYKNRGLRYDERPHWHQVRKISSSNDFGKLDTEILEHDSSVKQSHVQSFDKSIDNNILQKMNHKAMIIAPKKFDLTLELLKEYVHSLKDFSTLLKIKEQSKMRDSSTSPITVPRFETNIVMDINQEQMSRISNPNDSLDQSPELQFTRRAKSFFLPEVAVSRKEVQINGNKYNLTPDIQNYKPNDLNHKNSDKIMCRDILKSISPLMTQSDYWPSPQNLHFTANHNSSYGSVVSQAAFHRPMTQDLCIVDGLKDITVQVDSQQVTKPFPASDQARDDFPSPRRYKQHVHVDVESGKLDIFTDTSSDRSLCESDNLLTKKTQPKRLPITVRANRPLSQSKRPSLTGSDSSKTIRISPTNFLSDEVTRQRTNQNKRWSQLVGRESLVKLLHAHEVPGIKRTDVAQASIPSALSQESKPKKISSLSEARPGLSRHPFSVSPVVSSGLSTISVTDTLIEPGNLNGITDGPTKSNSIVKSSKSDALTQTVESAFDQGIASNAVSPSPEEELNKYRHRDLDTWPLSLQSVVKPMGPPPFLPVQFEISKDSSIQSDRSQDSQRVQRIHSTTTSSRFPRQLNIPHPFPRRFSLRALRPVSQEVQDQTSTVRRPNQLRTSRHSISHPPTPSDTARSRSVHFSSDVLVAHPSNGPEPLVISSAPLKEPAHADNDIPAQAPSWFTKRAATIPPHWNQNRRDSQDFA